MATEIVERVEAIIATDDQNAFPRDVDDSIAAALGQRLGAADVHPVARENAEAFPVEELGRQITRPVEGPLQRHRRASLRISRAALYPHAPMTPPPGCVAAPQR